MLALQFRQRARLCREAFASWHGAYLDDKHRGLVQVITMSHNRLLTWRAKQEQKQAFSALRAVIAEGKRKRHVLGLMALRKLFALRARAFAGWWHVAVVEAARARLLRRAKAGAARRSAGAHLEAWAGLARDRRARRALARACARSHGAWDGTGYRWDGISRGSPPALALFPFPPQYRIPLTK